MMRKAWTVAVFAILASSSFFVRAQGLTEAEVQALLARLDGAFPAQDIDTIAASLGDAVEIRSTMAIGTEVQTYRYDKSSYLKALQNSWAAITGYRYERSDERIVVSGAEATATAQVVESAVAEGGVVTTRMTETVTIERANGAVVVTRVVGNGRVTVEPR